jgi:hypothetical protein
VLSITSIRATAFQSLFFLPFHASTREDTDTVQGRKAGETWNIGTFVKKDKFKRVWEVAGEGVGRERFLKM